MWSADVAGQTLKFHLSGINNQNFIMHDEQTGTWWQQVSGEALHGPLKGNKLTYVLTDEVTFAVWKREHPDGRVLRFNDRFSGRYEALDWEADYEKMPVVVPIEPADQLKPRDLVVGVELNGQSIAFPMSRLQKTRLAFATLGNTPIAVMLGEDQKSVRAFITRLDGQDLNLTMVAGTQSPQFIDAETSTRWSFSGAGLSGKLAGKQLSQLGAMKDYWFDWKIYHPDTRIYTAPE